MPVIVLIPEVVINKVIVVFYYSYLVVEPDMRNLQNKTPLICKLYRSEMK